MVSCRDRGGPIGYDDADLRPNATFTGRWGETAAVPLRCMEGTEQSSAKVDEGSQLRMFVENAGASH